MKKKVLLLLTLFLVFCKVYSQAKNDFIIEGELVRFKKNPEKILLQYSNGSERITDTCILDGNRYKFTGSLEEPTLTLLIALPFKDSSNTKSMGTPPETLNLFIGKGKIKVVSVESFTNISISGVTVYHREYKKLMTLLAPSKELFRNTYELYWKAQKNKQTNEMKILRQRIDSTTLIQNAIHAKFAKENSTSPLALWALNNYITVDFDAFYADSIFNRLPQAVKTSITGEKVKDNIKVAKRVGIGRVAPEFTQPDSTGKLINLSMFYGKYLLIDFWASWCVPCRNENPGLVKAYNQFSKNGFEILSVAIEKSGDRKKWLDAIYHDKLNWTHVSDLKFWDNSVAKLYYINALPQNFLLDPSGKIIAKNLSGATLFEKLKEAIK
jgi:peroxiredoxin